jgi:hypothetical protein
LNLILYPFAFILSQSTLTVLSPALELNPVAPWELRIGDLRVHYEVSDEPQPTVTVLAIGVKERDRVRIGGEIIEL